MSARSNWWKPVSPRQAEQIGPQWLEYLLESRAKEESAKASVKGKKSAVKTVAPEVVRVYQFEGQRHVRDLRTKVRNNNLDAVLAGDLDDFILAYLRETEAETAWDEPEDLRITKAEKTARCLQARGIAL